MYGFFNKICTPEYLFNEEQLAAFKEHDLNHYQKTQLTEKNMNLTDEIQMPI